MCFLEIVDILIPDNCGAVICFPSYVYILKLLESSIKAKY